MRPLLPLLALALLGPAAASAQGIDIVFPGGRVRIGGDDRREPEPPPVVEETLPAPSEAPLYTPEETPIPGPTLAPPPAPGEGEVSGDVPEDVIAGPFASRVQAFRTLLTGATLTGRFTTDGKDGLPEADRYDISSAEPVGGSQWVITTRVRYGEKDFEIPVVVDVRWAGPTPMVVLENTSVPGLGTFSAHVLFEGDRYAGTWQHGEKGGHLFGTIGPAADDASPATETGPSL